MIFQETISSSSILFVTVVVGDWAAEEGCEEMREEECEELREATESTITMCAAAAFNSYPYSSS